MRDADVPQVQDDMMFEVRVYQKGDLMHREQCGSMEQAWLVIDEWAEMGDVSCEVGGMLVRKVGSFVPGGSGPAAAH